MNLYRTIGSALLCAMMVIHTIEAARADDRTWYVAISPDSYANIRQAPDETSKIIGTVASGQTFTQGIDFNNGWFYIAEKSGYIKYTLLSVTPLGSREAVIAGGGLVNIRQDIDGPLFKRVKPGTAVRVLAELPGRTDDWYKIRIGKKIGWVKAEFVQIDEGAQ